MGKRSHKRREKDHLGCMSGLIHIFNFRQGQSTRRLITDRRRVNAKQPVGAVYMRDKLSLTATTNQRHEGSNISIITSLRLQNGESKTSEMGKASVKALMDEEMSKVQKSKKKLPESVLEQIKHELLLQGSLEKSGMQENRNLNVNSCHPNSAEIFPVIDEFCSHNHYSQEAGLDQKTLNMPLVQKGLIVEERLETAMESFLNKKFIEAKKLSRGETLHQSKELKDALEILNLNKELFVKLLQDPNSLLMKHIQDLRNAQTAKLSKGDLGKPLPGARFSEQEVQDSRQTRMLVKQFYFQKQNGHHKFFGRKSKPKDENKLTESEISGSASRRIVVLKPSPSPSQSHFSLEEIKRKLKSVIGESRKEKHWMFIDKISYKRHHSTDCRETSPQNEKTSKVSTRPTSDKRGNSKEYKPQQREPFIYKEAKNHLTEMLEMENKDGDLAAKQLPKTLGRNFSSTENSTIPLRFSPGRAQERFSLNNIHSSTECVRQVNIERPANQLNPQMENGEDSNNPDAELGGSDLDTEFETGIISDDREDESNCIRGHFSPKDVEIKDITDSMCLEESESTEPDRSPVTEEYGHGHTGYSRQDLSGEKSQLLSLPESFSAGHILIHKNEALESIYEKPERLSPVSVLESLFSDSEISPATSVAQHGELSIQPRQIHFEKHNTSAPSEIVWDQEINPQPLIEEDKTSFKYIRTVLAASGMNCDELKRRGCSSDPPIDPSLLDEVGAPPRQISEDKKLLFDCINEALLEIYERYFGCTPWVSFIKSEIRPIPIGKNIVQEVLEGIDWCLLPLDSCTLDQIIGKDMAKVGSWMDLCSKAEKVGFEMGDSILDKLMEEMILELWD